LEKTQELFTAREVFEFPTPPFAFAKSESESLIVAGIGNTLRFLRFRARSFMLMDMEIGPLPSQIAALEINRDLLWVGDRTQSVFCYRFTDEFTVGNPPIAVDPEPRAVTAMCVIDGSTVVVGDRFGVVTFLKLPNDLTQRDLDWKKSPVPDRGIAQPFAEAAGHLQTVATFSLGEAVTALIRPPESQILFYTTLLGKIGAFVPITELDVDFEMLSLAELLTARRCAVEFGVTLVDQHPPLHLNVISADMLDFIDQLDPESQNAIEAAIKMPKHGLFGVVSRLKYLAKF
jgi:splicing factor 3B subunit 3